MRRSPRLAFDTRGKLGEYREELGREARSALVCAGAAAGLGPEHEISLTLCDGPWIRRVNRYWRGIDRATDVLSFPSYDLEPGQAPPPGTLGDIVVCLPELRREARRLGVDVSAHLQLLLVHGLLHLLGHDHDAPAREAKMQRRERELLEVIRK
ncbi:rRNA maturation RNase YbeY [bacterium]|nr:rRNA maturation RNase YbeY [bacterium]